jgi:catechol 2,3-dioxygenase-like lactoylglutathione lyase family enzyme
MTALSHLFVHVGDLARTRVFYVDLQGLEPLMEGGGYPRVGGGHAGLTDPDGYRLSIWS